MLDLFLSAAITTSQAPIIAQSQAATVYLPISTTQSSRQNCVTYKAINVTGRALNNVGVNRRDRKGRIYKDSSIIYLSYGILEPRGSINFDLCDNSFVNVEAKQ